MRKLLLVVLASSLAFQLPVSAQTPAPGGTGSNSGPMPGRVARTAHPHTHW